MACIDERKLSAFAGAALTVPEMAQVQAHLDGCERCRVRLAELQDLGADPTLTPTSGPSLDTVGERAVPISKSRLAVRREDGLLQGDQVGRYVILERIAAGGMGEVYAAYDPQLDRRVALKLLRPDVVKGIGAKEGRNRLLREAQAMARLSHPNVVTVHDVGTTQDQQVFVAMEFVDGQTLRDLLRSRPTPWREVVELFVKAGRGVAAAHAAGLVHRDFKPHNVLVGKDGRVCVLDFGLARPAVLANGDSSPSLERDLPEEVTNSGPRVLEANLTQTGSVMGTPGYMSPEQLRSTPTDARTDQFSFCVALYEALYGERPFKATNLRDLEHEVFSGVFPDPPSESSVPQWLYELVKTGMAVKPADRFASMNALLTALSANRGVSRRRKLLLAAAAGGLALVVAGGALVQQRARPGCDGGEAKLKGVWDGPRRELVQKAFTGTGKAYAEDAFRGVDEAMGRWTRSWSSMRLEACEATRVRGEQSEELLYLRMVCLERKLAQARALSQLLTQAGPEVVENAVKAANALDSVAACAAGEGLSSAQQPPANPATAAKVEVLRERLAEVKALYDAGQYARGIALCLPLAVEARGTGYRPIEAEAFLLLARLQERSAEYKAAEQSAHAAAWAAEATGWTEEVADAWILLVQILARDSRFAEADRWVGYAQAAVGSLPSSPLREGDLEQTLAYLGDQEGRYAEAVGHGRRALVLVEGALGPDHQRVAEVADQLAMSISWLGFQEEALAFDSRALGILEKLLGKEHPEVARVLTNVASVEEELGRFEDARVHHERALVIVEKAFGPTASQVARSLNNLGLAYDRLGRFEDADRVIERALAIVKEREGEGHPRNAHVLHSLADSKRGQGKAAEALVLYKKALEIYEAGVGKDHPALAYYLTGIGECLTDLGQAKEALAPLERALQLRLKDTLLPIELGRTRAALARALWAARGDRARANELAESARSNFKAAGAKAGRESKRLEEWLSAQRGL
ncbi:MAG: tetratricopeptide repeat protein [Myxococcaceae bacterium]